MAGSTQSPGWEAAFRGRESALDRLDELVRGGCTWLSIVGAPGVGKSRLAVEFADRFRGSDNGRFESVEIVSPHVGTMVSDGCEAEDVVDHFESVAEAGPVLLVLDPREPFELETLRSIFRRHFRGTESAAIVTRYAPTRFEGEAIVRVGPASTDAAAELFRDIATRMVGEAPTSDEEEVRSLVDSLDCVPLVIEAVASLDTVRSVAELDAQFEERRGILASLRAWNETRWLGRLRGAVARAWDALSRRERRALEQVACFRDSFPADAAREVVDGGGSVAGDVIDLLDDLYRTSMLWRVDSSSGGPRRFLVPALVREFAREEGDASGELEAARRRMVRYYVEQSQELIDRNLGHRNPELVPHICDEIPNITEAFEVASGYDVRSTVELATALVRSIAEFTPERSAEPILEKAWACVERAGEYDGCTEDRSRLVREGGLDALRRRHLDEARPALEKALRYAEELGDRPGQVRVLTELALIANLEEDFGKGDALVERAAGMLEDVDEPDLAANVWVTRGVLFMKHDDRTIDEARSALRRGAAACRETDNDRRRSVVVSNLGFLEMYANRFDLAREYLEEAHESVRERGIVRIGMMVRAGLGCCALAHDELERAKHLFEEVIEEAKAAENFRLQLDSIIWLGVLALREGRWRDARRILDEGLELTHLTNDDVVRTAHCHAARGAAAYMDGEREEGDRAFQRAREVADEELLEVADKTIEVYEVFRVLGRVRGAAEHGETGEVRRELEAALDVIRAGSESGADPFYVGSGDACLVARVVENFVGACREAWLPDAQSDEFDGLRVGPRAEWFELPQTGRVDLSTRSAPRLIFQHLVERRRAESGAASDVHDLLDVGWPEATLRTESGRDRVYAAIRTLRELGLRDVLRTGGDGYLLDPDTPLEVKEDA